MKSYLSIALFKQKPVRGEVAVQKAGRDRKNEKEDSSRISCQNVKLCPLALVHRKVL